MKTCQDCSFKPTTVSSSSLAACLPLDHFVPCAGGHAFQYTDGGTGGRCPDGIPCQCGAMLSKWETCPTCGQDRLIAVPANNGADRTAHGTGEKA